jgi:hypothetical protein
MTSIEQMTGITTQYSEIVKQVSNGSLDVMAVKQALQDLIDGKLPTTFWSPSTWWRTTEHQLERARQLWPNAVLPEPPKNFKPRRKSEVMLLHVPDSTESLWTKVVPPQGYTKCHSEGIKFDEQSLRLAPGKHEYTEPTWLAFDYEHGKGKSPDSFWGQADIAASEVLSALIQFPEWPLAWLNGASPPNISGYQLKDGGTWSNALWLGRWKDDHLLQMDECPADGRDAYWASPSVREC